MKKILILIIFNIIFNRALALNTTASQAIIYDYEAKTVILKNLKNLFHRSIVKYDNLLFIQKLKDGEIQLTDEFKVSKKAWKRWLKNVCECR